MLLGVEAFEEDNADDDVRDVNGDDGDPPMYCLGQLNGPPARDTNRSGSFL